MSLRERQEVVVVPANPERGATVSGVVETRDRRQDLREQTFLHFARDFNLAVQALALRNLVGDLTHEIGILERESSLRGDRLEQADVGTGVRFFRLFRAEGDESEKFVAHSNGKQELRAKASQFAALFLSHVNVTI